MMPAMPTRSTCAGAIPGLIAAALLLAATTSAQSLGEVARRQRTQRGPQARPDRVYTDDNLPRAGGVNVVGPQAPDQTRPERKPGEKLAPFVPSPLLVVEKMLTLAGVGPGDTVYDLGCGDGRIIIMAAQTFGAQAVGVELDEKLYRSTLSRIRQLNLQDKVKVIHGDLLEVDLSPATVVTLYLLPSANEKVRPNLEKYLSFGARVVSHDFEMPGWEDKLIGKLGPTNEFQHALYLYRR